MKDEETSVDAGNHQQPPLTDLGSGYEEILMKQIDIGQRAFQMVWSISIFEKVHFYLIYDK